MLLLSLVAVRQRNDSIIDQNVREKGVVNAPFKPCSAIEGWQYS